MNRKPIILGSVSLLSLLLAGPALAQTAAADTDATAGDDIVVTGVRASIVGALNVRKQSTQIVDSIVAEDVGKLPDNNVVEALQRVTGVQVTDRGNGEAGTISIRGLPDPVTTLNGRNIFTAAGQSFALQDVSANLIKSVDIYKTRAADQLETGLAGQVDIKTRRPFDFNGFAISALARGVYNEQSDKIDPNAALLISDRWTTGIGDIGLLVNGSYNKSRYRTQSVTAGAFVPFATENPPAGSGFTPLQRIFGGWPVGTNAGLPTAPGSTLNINGVDVPYYLSRDAVFSTDLYGERERPSVNVALQWAPNSSSVYTAEFYYSGFRGKTYNDLMFSFVDWWGNLGNNPGSTIQLYPGTNIVKSRQVGNVAGFNSGDYATNRTDSFVYALNGKWDVGDGRGKIVADLAYQTSKNRQTFFAMRTYRPGLDVDVDFNAGGGIPSYKFANSGVLTDPGQWTLGELYDNANRDTGSAATFTLDGDYNWDSGFLRRIKAGIRYDARKADSWVRTQDAGVPLSNGAPIPLTALGASGAFTNSGFFDGLANVPTSWVTANTRNLWGEADTIRSQYGLATSNDLFLTHVFAVDENTMSAYIMADGELTVFGRPLKLEAGVRYTTVSTHFSFTDRYAENPTPTASANHSDRFLPSFTARYDLTDRLHLRFNYGETLRRPNFSDLNPNYNLTGDLTGTGNGSGSAGNPNLRPTVSRNYDLALEWYFDRSSAIYATGFIRDVDGLVVTLPSRRYIPNNGITAGPTDYFIINSPVNASKGVLKGVELGLTYFPTYLPGPLNGLGFVGSLTLLDSHQNIPEADSATGQIVGESTAPFFGVSNVSYNATLAYDHGPIGARLSYIWRKGFIQSKEAALFANPIDIWRKAERSLDFQLTYSVTKDLGVTFDAVNLTKSKQQNYYRYENVGNATEYNLGTTLLPRTFAVGVRYTFK
ncbi:TonB-dependent receptor [Sphingomonas sp.]|uniref:TonB-dependent receptor n=3 Tax=unclassified Sphingomonas TaxID=196159 RepID=UPI002580F071|nr:TonB-dependent receptor [Sphingomonas sp.]